MANITGTQVRDRLRTMGATEVSDADLATAPFIPAGDGWLNKILSNNGYTLATLGSDDQAMAKAAEIAFVAAKVISSAPVRGSETGPIKIKPIPAKDKKEMVDTLRAEWKEYLDLIGCSIADIYFSSTDGDDYKPDGDDDTNLMWTDEDEDTFSQWP